MKYKQFIFDHYSFNPEHKRLELHYAIDDALRFTESYSFDFDYAEYDPQLLDVAAQTLFFMAGVSYYKTYLPEEIIIRAGHLDQQSADFFSRTYQRGLGEFFYVNDLDPRTDVTFPANVPNIELPAFSQLEGALIGIGGGKDSLLSVELLRDRPGMATWSVGHKKQLQPLIERLGLQHYWVEREWDKQLLELNKQDAFNGHVPISAILASAGTVAAVLAGKRDIIVSNESSANEPTLQYRDTAINHQYSKSLMFEQEFQNYLTHRFNGSVRYYSILRPFSEVRIAELFADKAFEKYDGVFSSCNRAFTHDSDRLFWCGECPKCTFVFLALTPFIEQERLEKVWGGKNLLLDDGLGPTYRQLLGIEGDKPLECVGEIKESRAAMRLAQEKYPQLKKYAFELPAEYDFRAMSAHSIPEDMLSVLDPFSP